MSEKSILQSAAARLVAFGLVLAAALGGGALVGATLGPESSEPDDAATHDESEAAATASDLPPGLAVSRDGYTIDLLTPLIAADGPAELTFVIEGPDGRPVTDYAVEHDKELHLVIVGRDLAGYAHVHPSQDADGRWSVAAPALAPGSYRVFADFVPAGGDSITLGTDLAVAGDYVPVGLPDPSSVDEVDGYEVTFHGELVAGTESELTVSVTRGGAPVSDLQPYLGALGHLVAIRNGDLAYLHVHPLDDVDGPGGPAVRFAVEVPTEDEYGLFFDFSHGDQVRNASTITTVTSTDQPASPVQADDSDDDHDTHGS